MTGVRLHKILFSLGILLSVPELSASPRCNKNATVIECKIGNQTQAFTLSSPDVVLESQSFRRAKSKVQWLSKHCTARVQNPGNCDWISLVVPPPASQGPREQAAAKTAPPKKAAAAVKDKTDRAPAAKVAKSKRPGRFQPRDEEVPDPSRWARKDCAWDDREIDQAKLAALLKAQGFSAPASFRALVVEIELAAEAAGKKKTRIVKALRTFSWDNKADDVGGWNPASTVKLFSAAGALELLRQQGYFRGAEVVFHYPSGDKSFTFKELLWLALYKSDNIAHDRLMQIAGFDEVNDERGVAARAGLTHTAVMRAYEGTRWEAEGHNRSLRDSPAFSLHYNKDRVEVPTRIAKSNPKCGGAACTTLSDLSKMMCVLMLHENLPYSRRLHLGGSGEMQLLDAARVALRTKRDKGPDPVWEAFVQQFPKKAGSSDIYPIYRKGGFSEDWLSDNLFIVGKGNRRWIVTMAAYGGRGALTKAAHHIAKLIKSEGFSPRPKKTIKSKG